MKSGTCLSVLIWLLVAVVFSADFTSAAEPAPKFSSTADVRAFYGEHCVRCHKEGKAKGDFRMDELLARADIAGRDDPWKNILDKLASREMPPDDEEKRPSHAEYEEQIIWLRGELEKSEQITASARPRDLRRLNRQEYSNVIKELFGLDLKSGDDLPPDDALYGFDTVAEGQSLSSVHADSLLKSAKSILDSAFPEEPWPGLVRNQNYLPSTHPDEFSGSMQWGFKAPEGFMWTFRTLGPGGYGPLTHSGVYHVRMTVVPHHLQGAKDAYVPQEENLVIHDFRGRFKPHLVAIVCGREVAEFHILPDQEGKEVVLDFETFIPKGTEISENEIRFVNGTPGDWALLRRGRTFSWEKRETYPTMLGQMPSDLPFLLVIRKEFSGPLKSHWPTPQVKEILAAGQTVNDPAGSIGLVLPKAFRRPVTPEEIETYARIARDEIKGGASYIGALKVALQSILISPHFLFIVENAPESSPRGSSLLNPYELATRLSLFLWSSMPDEELMRAASDGSLAQPATLRAQTARMLLDPRAAGFAQRFAYQWLGLSRLAGSMPDRTLFKEFNWNDEMYEFYGTRLLKSMAREPIAFFENVLRKDAPITDFLDSDHIVVDQPLSRLYGLNRVIGGEFTEIPINPGDHRGGLLGMAGILTLTSEQTRTSPVIRGTWVLKRIFNRPPPPPPPGVGMIEPDTRNATTLRQKLALHSSDPSCARCHARIDPYGMTLENFDAIGRWRSREPAWFDPARPEKVPPSGPDGKPATFPIDSSAQLADGSTIRGYIDLKQHLMKRRDDFALGFSEKMFIYATGRGVLFSDSRDLAGIVEKTKSSNCRIKSLILAIVESHGFRHR